MKKLTVATYNLHGMQENNDYRFFEIARQLCDYDVDICGFQEVVKSRNIEDTSYQIARHMREITGKKYYTWWQHCHMFYDKYPEGVSILSASPFVDINVINLDVTAGKKNKPLMPRFALFAQIEHNGCRVLFTTTHLDHHKAPGVRTAQAKKITQAFEELCAEKHFDLSVITGDFNANERTDCLKHFRRCGFVDSYRSIYRRGGDTFPASGPYCRIDYILYKGRFKVIAAATAPYDGNELSDHLGVVTMLEKATH